MKPSSTVMPTAMKNRPSKRPRNGAMSAATWCRYSVSATIRPATKAPSAIDRPACWVAKLAPSTSRTAVAVNTSSASIVAMKPSTGAQQIARSDRHDERDQDRLGQRDQQRARERAGGAERVDQHQQRPDREVLDQQDRDRDSAELGQRPPEVGDHPQDHGSRGQRERAADHDRGVASEAQALDDERDAGGGDQQLGQRERVDPGAEQAQALDLELEAEVEQQEDDAELGERADRLQILDQRQAGRPDHRAADQEAQHRAQPQAHEQRRESDEHQQDDQGFPHAADPFFSRLLRTQLSRDGGRYRGGAAPRPAGVARGFSSSARRRRPWSRPARRALRGRIGRRS